MTSKEETEERKEEAVASKEETADRKVVTEVASLEAAKAKAAHLAEAQAAREALLVESRRNHSLAPWIRTLLSQERTRSS